MALVKCKECQKEVAKSAKTCPHCGVANPSVTNKQMAIGFIALAVIVLALFSTCSSDEPPQEEVKKEEATVEKTAEQVEKENAECKKSLECWSDKNAVVAQVACQQAIEKMAKYDYEWTDGLLDPVFSKMKWKDEKQGIITYYGDKIKMQNGFGAYSNYIYACDFNPETESVLDVRMKQGKI